MKKIIVVLASFLIFGSAHAVIKCGDKVLETYEGLSLQTVKAISGNGKYLLSDDEWYDQQWIHELTKRFAGLKVGDNVLETSGTWSILAIKAIATNGYFLLNDNAWYSWISLEELVKEYMIELTLITIGDKVMESYNDYSLRTVKAISANGKFLLDDDIWYDEQWIHYADSCSSCH